MNKPKLFLLTAGLVWVLIVAGAVGATAAYADDPTPTAEATQVDPVDGPHRRGGPGLPPAELEAAAKLLGMSTEELSAALKDGKTLDELAEAAGVDVEELQETLKTVRASEMRARIEQAVSDGTMTQEKADWLLEGLEKGFLDGPGFGFGGHGMGGPPPGEPAAADRAAPTAAP